MTTSHPWLARYVDGDAAVHFTPAFNDGLSLFRHAVATHADGPAICYFDRVMSYAEVDRLSDAFAGWLASHGIAAGDRVALYLQNVPQFPICLLGAWKIGAIGVSINPMNRSRELTLLLRDSGARVLVAHRSACVRRRRARSARRHHGARRCPACAPKCPIATGDVA